MKKKVLSNVKKIHSNNNIREKEKLKSEFKEELKLELKAELKAELQKEFKLIY